jgi:hypothetical protein
MRTREEIEAKIAEIDAVSPDGHYTAQNATYRLELLTALEAVDSQQLEYSWTATAVSWANGDIETLRIEGYPVPPGELEGPNA